MAPLGKAGGARRVHQRRHVVGADAGHDALGIAARDQLFIRRAVTGRALVGRGDLHHFAHQAARRGGTRDVQGLRRRKQHAGRGIVEDVAHLGRGEPEIDRHEHRAQLGHGQRHFQKVRAVERQQRHAIARAHTARAQRAGQRVGPLLQFAKTELAAGVGVDQRHPLGVALGVHGAPVANALIHGGFPQ